MSEKSEIGGNGLLKSSFFIQNYFSHKFTAQTMSEPPAYENVQDQFLNPELVFDAEKYRLFYQERDRAFAKAIVDYIASIVKRQNLPVFEQDTECFRRCNAEYRTSWWDDRVGYPALEAFKTKRVPFIEAEARLDLHKRGFVVHGLDLYYETLQPEKSQKRCETFHWYCTCEQHGIFVRWKLGLG